MDGLTPTRTANPDGLDGYDFDYLIQEDRVHRHLYTEEPIFKAEMNRVFGAVWVYLPQEYCDQYFALGSKYQQSLITPAAVLEISQTLAQEISEALSLDHPLMPLQFLDGAGSGSEEASADDEAE